MRATTASLPCASKRKGRYESVSSAAEGSQMPQLAGGGVFHLKEGLRTGSLAPQGGGALHTLCTPLGPYSLTCRPPETDVSGMFSNVALTVSQFVQNLCRFLAASRAKSKCLSWAPASIF